ncbi:MAG: ostA-like family protein [Alphaproteobacteria bacterium]|nr:ostA-like family protein [Alphaproteobacteria bacterium]
MSNSINWIDKGRTTFIFALCCAILCSIPLCARAQGVENVNPDRDKPIEITADESLEWHRNDLFFKAKENVHAVQGMTKLSCDELIAKYRNSEKSNIDIYSIEASGNVSIISADSKVYGQKAVYDVDKGLAQMTGKNLRLVSEDQTVRARDKFIYQIATGRLEAIGNAVAVREGDKIEADKLVTVFVDGKDGKRRLKTFDAIGHVVITTPDEVLTGKKARYDAKTSVAELTGNVRITRGQSFVEGVRAQVDLNTNISKIFGAVASSRVESNEVKTEDTISGQDNTGQGDTGQGRVRAIFYPKEKTP